MKHSVLTLARVAIVSVASILAMGADTPKATTDGELRTSRYVYTGGVTDGKQNGFGICRYTNGNVYAGHWNMGYKEGLGRMEFADGTMDFGMWRQGILTPPKGRKFKPGERCSGIDVAKYQKKIDWTKPTTFIVLTTSS